MASSSPSGTDRIAALLEEAEQLKLDAKYEGALAVLHRVLMEDPGNVTALEEVADNEVSLGRYDRASAAAKRAVELNDGSSMGHYILGFIASLKENWDVALKELQLANKLRPNDPEILRTLGWTLFNAEQPVQGVVTLERSLNLDPENAMSLCDLGVCYLRLQNYGKAHVLFSRALELDPANQRAKECVEAVARMKKEKER
jgi:Flp pilus assembly protein TadD